MTFFGYQFSFYALRDVKKNLPAKGPTVQQQAPSFELFFKKMRRSFSRFFEQKPMNNFKHVCGKACGLGCFHGGSGPRDNPFSVAPTDRYNKAGWRNK